MKKYFSFRSKASFLKHYGLKHEEATTKDNFQPDVAVRSVKYSTFNFFGVCSLVTQLTRDVCEKDEAIFFPSWRYNFFYLLEVQES